MVRYTFTMEMFKNVDSTDLLRITIIQSNNGTKHSIWEKYFTDDKFYIYEAYLITKASVTIK